MMTMQMVATSVFMGGERGAGPSASSGVDHGAKTDRGSVRVLVVEDELFVALHLEAVVEDMGHSVCCIVSNGEAALDEVDFHAPDLVFMDVNLGAGIDGVEAARRITRLRKLPVIFVSAYGDEATRSRIAEAAPGAQLVAKPVTPGALRRALEQLAGPPAH